MMTQELYDKICKVLTWYEHPDEYPWKEDDFPWGEHRFNQRIAEEMYNVLVEVQNSLFNP